MQKPGRTDTLHGQGGSAALRPGERGRTLRRYVRGGRRSPSVMGVTRFRPDSAIHVRAASAAASALTAPPMLAVFGPSSVRSFRPARVHETRRTQTAPMLRHRSFLPVSKSTSSLSLPWNFFCLLHSGKGFWAEPAPASLGGVLHELLPGSRSRPWPSHEKMPCGSVHRNAEGYGSAGLQSFAFHRVRWSGQ